MGTFASSALLSPLEPHSPQAHAIADLFVSTLEISAVIFAVVTGLIAYCIYRFRDRDGEAPKQIEGHTRLEIAWTVAPVIVLGWLFVLTLRAMNVSDPPVDREPDITVIGHQWWWEARYKSGAVTANEIHIPTGKALVLRVESADVVHDFWVPDIGRKIDAVPGRSANIWVEASSPGTYVGACAEYCGVQHAWMRITVVAEEPDAFAAWERHELAGPAVPTDAKAQSGATIFRSKTCSQCHAIGSEAAPRATVRVGPDLTHLAERHTLGAGVLNNTPDDLTRWLKDPQAVKAGCYMPNAQLTDADAAALVAYFETLR